MPASILEIWISDALNKILKIFAKSMDHLSTVTLFSSQVHNMTEINKRKFQEDMGLSSMKRKQMPPKQSKH